MENITSKELLYLSYMSKIDLSEADMSILYERLNSVLQYASHLKDLVKTYMPEQKLPKNINVYRSDTVHKTNSQSILALAPDRQDNYFAVPMILKND